MKAEFVGCTLVVVPESERDKEDLKYYAGGRAGRLWTCNPYGYESPDTVDLQGLCPCSLQDNEIVNYLRFLLEMDERQYPIGNEDVRIEYLKQERKIVEQIRAILEEATAKPKKAA